MMNKSWECQRCFRVYSPETSECAHCNDPDERARWFEQKRKDQIAAFRIMGETRATHDQARDAMYKHVCKGER